MILPNNTEIFETHTELAETLAVDFKKKCKEVILRKGSVNVALSGGNTPKMFFKVLAEDYLQKLEWSKINFFWADERCVPETSSESNYGEAVRILFSKIAGKKNIFGINGEEIPDKEAERYSGLIKSNLPEAGGKPVFDMILLGLGEDGHTASVFPDNLKLLESECICAAVLNPAGNQFRITLTGKVINNAESIFFLVTGKSKAEVVRNIFEKKNDYMKYPATYIHNSKGYLKWYLDKDSAELIN